MIAGPLIIIMFLYNGMNACGTGFEIVKRDSFLHFFFFFFIFFLLYNISYFAYLFSFYFFIFIRFRVRSSNGPLPEFNEPFNSFPKKGLARENEKTKKEIYIVYKNIRKRVLAILNRTISLSILFIRIDRSRNLTARKIDKWKQDKRTKK